MTPTYKLSYQSQSEDFSVAPICWYKTEGQIANELMTLVIDGQQININVARKTENSFELLMHGHVEQVYYAQDDHHLFLHVAGQTWQLEIVNTFSQGASEGDEDNRVLAPMPGVVLELKVGVDDSIEAGQALMLIESMKLQTEVKASTAGTIKHIHYEAGQTFDKGALLLEINGPEQDGSESVESKGAESKDRGASR